MYDDGAFYFTRFFTQTYIFNPILNPAVKTLLVKGFLRTFTPRKPANNLVTNNVNINDKKRERDKGGYRQGDGEAE